MGGLEREEKEERGRDWVGQGGRAYSAVGEEDDLGFYGVDEEGGDGCEEGEEGGACGSCGRSHERLDG